MVGNEDTNENNSKTGSPPAAADADGATVPPKTTTDAPAPVTSAASANPPPPPPPPPAHHAPAHHPYYAYGHPPPGYEHLPPGSERAAPGPYTTAQYDAHHGGSRGKATGGAGMVPPPYHQGSPQSHIPHGREHPPHPHYPPLHAPTLPTGEHPHPPAGYPPYPKPGDEHRAAHAHWQHHYEAAYGPPPPGYYEAARAYQAGQPYPPPPPPHGVVDPHGAVHPPPLGPYRYSDHTLQREAVSRISKTEEYNEDEGREGATSPSQIESSHREEVTTMGCTCKKTKCLKLYCQCFAVKIYCGSNCRCMVCNNTQQFETQRKDAIRNILSRNPSAFDTKFKKEHESKEVQDRSLAHKLGCKCRKSACMKKYCECYAGGVKCSASCRCVGCKNQPREGMGPPSPDGANVYARRESTGGNSSSDDEMQQQGAAAAALTNFAKKREQPFMNAAQSLAFLKHASPMAEKPRRTFSTDTGENGSMPSLASEESPSSGPRKTNDKKTVSVTGASSIPEPTSSEKTAVNALLMAARAMASMSGGTEAAATTTTEPPEEEKIEAASTPPSNNHTKSTEENDEFVTPQKNLLGAFKSPKRKQQDSEGDDAANPQDTTTAQAYSSEYRRQSNGEDSSPSTTSADGDDDSPKREHPGDETPSNVQKIKRSRIGSLKKGPPRNLGNDMEGGATTTSSSTTAMDISYNTPQTKGKLQNNDLTPVSARCIDFKKMHVNELQSTREI